MNRIQPKKIDYHWSGQTKDGRIFSGVIQAMSPNVAKMYLKKQGIIPSKIKKKTRPFYWRSSNKISANESIVFLRQLATLISAGIPILQCCDILSQTQTSEAFQAFIQEIRKEISTGKTLSTSLKKFPFVFEPSICQLVFLGEQSGTLDRTLNSLANYKEKSSALRKRIFQALLYPTIILITAVLITLVMLTFVVPRFEELFNNMHTPLPLFTQGIVNISHFLRHNSWLGLVIVSGILIIKYYLNRSIALQHQLDYAYLKTPILKDMLQKIISARFTRHLATLFGASIPILECLKLTAPILSNHAYIQALEVVQKEIARGQHLHVALQKNTNFPALVIQMIKMGEESGTLETMLYKLAEQYESDIEYWITNLSHLLEPLIMIILGVLIGGLVIAMYLPIFKLGTII